MDGGDWWLRRPPEKRRSGPGQAAHSEVSNVQYDRITTFDGHALPRPGEPSLLEMAMALSVGGPLRPYLLSDPHAPSWCATLPVEVLGELESKESGFLDEVQREDCRQLYWKALATALFGPLPFWAVPFGILHRRDETGHWFTEVVLPQDAAALSVAGTA